MKKPDVVAFPSREDPPKPPSVERDPTASAEWDRVVALGCVDARHAVALAIYCRRYALTVRLWDELEELPDYTVSTGAGGLKSHPLLSQVNESERLLGMHASRLGLTPVDASRVKVAKGGGPKSPYLDGPGSKLSKYCK